MPAETVPGLMDAPYEADFPGESQVFADCVTSQGNVIVAFGPKFRVKPAADFYAEVRALLGESALA